MRQQSTYRVSGARRDYVTSVCKYGRVVCVGACTAFWREQAAADKDAVERVECAGVVCVAPASHAGGRGIDTPSVHILPHFTTFYTYNMVYATNLVAVYNAALRRLFCVSQALRRLPPVVATSINVLANQSTRVRAVCQILERADSEWAGEQAEWVNNTVAGEG
ncbi:hypothetical protein PC129_g24372 [Phytophthora cactorum]|uniref:Uncharacterized protein n=1 Tax=Phytophthora cactorum TaxID=29920 RepID=A0A8T1H0S1_9STRA|nr:hypothetical protein PC129_g24372 [Phytophthora cactorum]